MLVKHMKEWLADKADNRRIVDTNGDDISIDEWRIVWGETGEDVSFEEIGLTVEEKPEQQELFGKGEYFRRRNRQENKNIEKNAGKDFSRFQNGFNQGIYYP